MRGPSRASLAAARDRLTAALADPSGAAALGEELFAVTGLLDRELGVRRALTDVTSPVAARNDLARRLLEGRVSGTTLDLVVSMTSSHWAAPRDLADAAEELAVLATAAAAEDAGQLDDLEDELFRFGRIVGAQPDLRSALSDPLLPADRKRGLLDALLAGKVTPTTFRLITQAAVHPRGRSIDETLAEYARLAAAWRQRLIAVVRVATGLTESERGRLAAALSGTYGHDVHLNVVIDPGVVGGMSVQIGDEYIDGSIARRLADLRQRLAS
ncbi:MAG TPA: F0F1 ATP synthase subunit delta [Streptosporangiaceae bacterium]|nr:F0F1 ATP synthase subunit delta [Streptosporangiaceae bacterium]